MGNYWKKISIFCQKKAVNFLLDLKVEIESKIPYVLL